MNGKRTILWFKMNILYRAMARSRQAGGRGLTGVEQGRDRQWFETMFEARRSVMQAVMQYSRA
jgi:hypothetical protein